MDLSSQRCVIQLGSVVAIANVMDRDMITIQLGPRQARNVRLPVCVVRRSKCQPPADDEREADRPDCESFPLRTDSKPSRNHHQDEHSGEHRAEALWHVELQSQDRPEACRSVSEPEAKSRKGLKNSHRHSTVCELSRELEFQLSRRVDAGSTDAARRAGSNEATRAAAVSTSATNPNVRGSVLLTPYRKVLR